jgi:hypothetical protein
LQLLKQTKYHLNIQVLISPKIELKKMLIFELIAQIEFIKPKGSDNQVQNKNNYENTNSSFECFSKCINDIDCEIVARYHPSEREDCVKITDESSINQVQDAQYAKISSICHLF